MSEGGECPAPRTSGLADGRRRLEGYERLYHDGLVILAVHVPHGVGNFADGPVGLDGLDDYRHQVAGAASGVFHSLDGGLPISLVALGAHRPQAFDLFALQRLIHVQQRDRLFLLEFKRVHARGDGFVAIHSLHQPADRWSAGLCAN
jgi:hypothetical protein